MAYDATFLTGSDERAVDPISTTFFSNEDEINNLNTGHHVISLDDAKLTNAMEAYDQAIEIRNVIDQDIRSGKRLDDSSYRILKLSLKRIIAKSKISTDPLPAMESFDEDGKRYLSIAMENVVTDTIKTIWDKIKNFFIDAHNKIKTWFIKAFDGSAKLKSQAEALKARAENISGNAAKNPSFEMAGANYLNIKGKIASPTEILKGVQDIANTTSVLLDKNADSYNQLFPNLENALKQTVEAAKKMKDSNANTPKPNENQQASIADSFNGFTEGSGKSIVDQNGTVNITVGVDNKLVSEMMGRFFDAAKTAGIEVNDSNEVKGDSRWDGQKLYAFRSRIDYLGSIMLVLQTATKGVTNVESYSDIKTGYKISPEPILAEPKKIEDKGTFQTATPQIVIGICEPVIAACDTMSKYKLLFETRDKNTGNLLKQMEGVVSSNAGLKGVGERHIKQSIETTISLVKKLQDGETRWAKYAFSVLNKAIIYSRNSLAQY